MTSLRRRAPVEPGGTPYFNWSDNSITLLPYGWGFAVDPAEQSTATLEHAHDSRIGDLFAFVDFTRFHGSPEGADESTWYGEIGPRLSLGKSLQKDHSFALFSKSLFMVKDVLVAAQYERGEDADVSEAALVDVGFDLDVREAGSKPVHRVHLTIFGTWCVIKHSGESAA